MALPAVSFERRRCRRLVGLACVLGLALTAGGLQAGVRYNAQGQIVELNCDQHALSAEDRGPCGADGAIWVNLHDEQGRLVRQVEHHEGRLIAVREYWREGVLRFTEDRMPVEAGPTSGPPTAGPGGAGEGKGAGPGKGADAQALAVAEHPGSSSGDGATTRADTEAGAPAISAQQRVVRRYYYPEGRPRLETFSIDSRVELEREYQLDGSLVRETRRDALGRVTETRWHANRALASQLTPAAYGGRPARMLEEYWDNGLLRQRGTETLTGSRLGLFQNFRQDGVIEREEFYEDGRLLRRVDYDGTGKAQIEEDFRPDGSVRSSIRR